MAELDDLFGQIVNAQESLKGDNFKDGKGVVVIRELMCTKMNEGMTFVARTKIVSSQSKGDLDPVTKAPVEPNQPGTNVGWPQKLEKFKSAKGNVKSFILTLTGFRADQVTPEAFKEAGGKLLSREQPARGMLIGYETYQQVTRSGPNTGKVNTYVRWIHVPPSAGNSPAEIKARRDELDKTDPLG